MRVEQGENWTLYCGDCREVLPTLEGVDAVVTDPPYGIGFKYDEHDDTPKGYGKWLWSIIEQAESKLAPSSPVFVFQAMPNVRMFAEWFPREWRIFAACKNFVQMRPTPMQYAFDPVVVWWTDGDEKPFSAGTRSRDFFVANTAPIIGQSDRPERAHPCPRPEDQMILITEQWVRDGGTVLDMFAGAGTTGVACMKTGHKFIGIEISEKYFDIALRRIDHASRQRRMF